ncbi:MAG: alpha/beta fold hydrolase [Candidatus Hodarchaeales archaeon]
MPFAKINGINIYYEIHGEGDPLIFGNGIFMNTTSWVYQTPVFSKKYKVILYDMRGQGQSDKPNEPYSFESHADDQKALLDHLDISKVHYISISYGSEMALIFALKYPNMLKSLVICSAVSYIGPLLKNIGLLWKSVCLKEDPDLFYYSTVPFNFSEKFIQEQTEFFKQAKERYKQFNFPPAVRLMNAFLQLDISSSQLSEIKTPTCIIAGEKDILKPAYPYSALIHEKIPNSEMTIIQEAGHAIVLEKPEEFNNIVLGFLQKHH